MKAQVDSMKGEISSLTNSMSCISDLSTSIDGALLARRERISKLGGSHALLKKLQFLFELPARLRKCVELKAYPEAVSYYARAARILTAYRGMPSFKGIDAECTAIMADLVRVLHAEMDAPGTVFRRVVVCFALVNRLRSARGDPLAPLAAEWLERAKKQLTVDRATQDAVLHPPPIPKYSPANEFHGHGCGWGWSSFYYFYFYFIFIIFTNVTYSYCK
jgi:hypothetical protein